LKPRDIQTIAIWEKSPSQKKAELVELQKKNPPFGGFEGVPANEMRRIYVSPVPLMSQGYGIR